MLKNYLLVLVRIKIENREVEERGGYILRKTEEPKPEPLSVGDAEKLSGKN